jgi:hypothetical protein
VKRIACSLVVVLAVFAVALPRRTLRGEEGAAPAKPTTAQVAVWRKRLLEMRTAFEVAAREDRAASWERGRREIAAIDDPAAVPAIVKLLESEKNGPFRRALIQPLISLGGPEAIACLAKWSVEDQNPYVRQEACHGLVGRDELSDLLPAYLKYLEPVRQGRNMRFPTETAEALVMTGLAAPLKEGEQPDEKLVRGLVGALDSARVDVVQALDARKRPVLPDPRDSAARQKRKTPLAGLVPVPETPNPVVLQTLQEYTGADFQYDKKAWLAWLEERVGE